MRDLEVALYFKQKSLNQLGIFILILCLFSNLNLKSQYWMQKGGGPTIDEAYDIALDSAGNSYTTGYFTGTATFGAFSETTAGATDVFVVKTNALGAIEWLAKAGGTGVDRGLAIAANANGDCYITGFFSGTADFDGQSITSLGSQDVFIAKYNSAGVLQWVKRVGGAFADQGNDIALDAANNVIVTGEFRDVADFGLDSLTSLGNASDVFITKLNDAGAFQWTQKGSGANADRGLNVDTDGSGNIYATGQFSQTIAFDQVHTNSMFNVTYLIKFDAAGIEQWFRIIGGGSFNECKGLATTSSGDCYITGNFDGNLTFFGPGSSTVSSTYTNKFFVGAYNAQGKHRWSLAHGSESDLAIEGIGVDALGKPSVIGSFGCTLDEYASIYGSGTFNSVGYSDVFVSSFDTAGTWQYSRNTGGHQNDFGYGLAVSDSGMLYAAGSFKKALNFPVSGNFIASNLALWTGDSCTISNGYCGDPFYGTFYHFSSEGNSDAFFANCFDPNREPYDYYLREGTGCSREKILPCIGSLCQDTFLFCESILPMVNTHQCTFAGQQLSYRWNPAIILPSEDTLQTVTYVQPYENVVTVKSNDNCLETSDTVIHISLKKPLISDDKGVNNMSLSALDIQLCNPDTVQLTGFPLGNLPHEWTGPGLPGGAQDSIVVVTQTGSYVFSYTDEFGCQHSNQVSVTMQNPLPPFLLRANVPDTFVVCDGEFISIQLFDSIANPNGNPLCFNALPYQVATSYTINPTTFVLATCQSQFIITPVDSALHTLEAQVVRINSCGSDTHFISMQFFIKLLESPAFPNFNPTLQGGPYYCPGESITLVGSGSTNYLWSGPGIMNATNDSISVNEPGYFNLATEEADTGANGCISSVDVNLQVCIRQKPEPVLSVSNPVLCPGSSVIMTASHSVSFNPCLTPLPSGPYFEWYGPSGQLSSTGNTAFATEAGSYYVVFNDSDSCALVSNTITINQYTTPSLQVFGNLVICDGDSLTINAIAGEGSTIEWLPPLNGSEAEKTVYAPGIYACKITSCGIETLDSIEVFASQVAADVQATKSLCLNDSTTLYGSPGMNSYFWSPGGQSSDSIRILVPGIYSLTTTDSSGCVATSDPFTVRMDQVVTSLSLSVDTQICSGDSVVIEGNASMANYLWQPEGQTSQSITVVNPGSYWLETIDTNNCAGTSDTVQVDTLTTSAPLLLSGKTTFCEGEFVTITSTRTAGIVSYSWSPTLASSRSISVLSSGTHFLQTVDTAGCEANSQLVNVLVQPDNIPAPDVRDTSICIGTRASLSPLGLSSGDIKWIISGDTTDVFIGPVLQTKALTQTTIYQVWEDFGLCQSPPRTVIVSVLDCESVEIPNVFTPNGDGINDVFRTKLEANTCFHCYIYNRWGQPVYEMHEFNTGWDGTLGNTGNPLPSGVYYYLVEYCQYDEEILNFRGSITLIRE